MEGFGITGLLLLSLVLTTSGLRRYSEVQMEPNSLINICFAKYHKTGFKSIMSKSRCRHSSSADLLYKQWGTCLYFKFHFFSM